MKENKRAALVVVYYPTIQLVENIESYIDSVDFVYLYLNSSISDDLRNLLLTRFLGKVNFIGQEDNDGIGKALNMGIQRAIDDGFKILLTMDQDSAFEKGSVKDFFTYNYYQHSDLVLISPNHKVDGVLEYETSDSPLWFMTSGNLLLLDRINLIGPFREDFFIDGIDIEYCLRISAKNYSHSLRPCVELVHSLGEVSWHRMFFREIAVTNHPSLRCYYIYRNYLYLMCNFSPILVKSRLAKILIRHMICIWLFESDKYFKTKMALIGVLHGIRGKLGKLE